MMTNEVKNFQEMLTDLDFVETECGNFRKPRELVNYGNPVLQFLCADNPDIFPGRNNSTYEWIFFLEGLGLQREASPENFIECAKKKFQL
jgi:hypothetical protein